MQASQGMLFNSIQYAIFLAAVVGSYWSLPPLVGQRRARRYRQVLLLVTSYLFYATWDWRFCFLLAGLTVINFLIGRELGRTHDQSRRRLLLGCSVASTIGALVILKYLNFLIGSFEALLRTAGMSSSIVIAIAVPLGISFFTLHTLSYTIDVYRRELEPVDDLVVFGIFVAYFPQLLAGPLTRGRRMLPQFVNLPNEPDRVKCQEGLELILIGVFQKVAVADALAPFTQQLFAATKPGGSRNFVMLLVGMFASVVQFVLDYAGYSNIARGSSKLLGIELPYNFRQPITRSRNFQDYWRRHNMTVMAWFRDYVLRPLRRRTDSRARSSLLLVLIFTLSGLWHVAGWGWVLWGLAIGVWVAAEVYANRYREADRLARLRAESNGGGARYDRGSGRSPTAVAAPVRAPATRRTWVHQVGASVYVVSVLGASMVLFRSPTVALAWSYYTEVFRFAWTDLNWDHLLLFVYAVGAVIVVDQREHRMELTEGTSDPPTMPRAAMWGVMLVLVLVFSGGVMQPFVYFQF